VLKRASSEQPDTIVSSMQFYQCLTRLRKLENMISQLEQESHTMKSGKRMCDRARLELGEINLGMGIDIGFPEIDRV